MFPKRKEVKEDYSSFYCIGLGVGGKIFLLVNRFHIYFNTFLS